MISPPSNAPLGRVDWAFLSFLLTARACDTGPPQGRSRVPELLRVFAVVDRFSGSRPAFLPPEPYFWVCVFVAMFLSTETVVVV